MGKRVYLNIDTNEGVMFIPFISLEKLDCFTVGYDNKEELIKDLNKMLDLSLSVDEVTNIYISGDMYKKSDKGSLSQIKYGGDNYEIDSLIQMFSLYLKQDHRRLKRSDIRNVITEGMVKFKGGKLLSDRDIDLAVKVFFAKDYKNQRDAYFLIKDLEFANIKIDYVSVASDRKERLELHQLESREDDYFQYLIELASRGDEEFDRAMDELSKSSLEEISKALGKSYHGVLDGVSDENLESFGNIHVLEYCTDMSIDSLKDLTYEFRNISMFGRRR